MPSSVGTQRRETILVVDDEADIRETIRSWYRDGPYRIVSAEGGRQGLQLAVKEEPDLVLLDLRMPDLDGLAVARRLKESPSTRTIPIILLTACRDLESKAEAFSVGADDYITKPFQVEEVDLRVRATLRKRGVYLSLESRLAFATDENRQLEELLMIDEKTGLYNFREFQRRLKDEWGRAERYGTSLSLAMFDLDHFKSVNDRLGHQAGDVALREFATLVIGGARASDFAARYGGEEFAIILPHTDAEMAVRVAERTNQAVREFVFLEDESPTRVTVSAGVATYPSFREIDSVRALLRAADRALYEAKDRGRDCVVRYRPDGKRGEAAR